MSLHHFKDTSYRLGECAAQPPRPVLTQLLTEPLGTDPYSTVPGGLRE